jgi:hypothetical protein
MTSHAGDDPRGGVPLAALPQELDDAGAHNGLDAAFLQEVCELVAGELPDVVVSLWARAGASSPPPHVSVWARSTRVPPA